MKLYAGVGSRETPNEVLALMQTVAGWLDARDWTLQSGHATGADWAFECGQTSQQARIFLPWKDFGCKPYKSDPGRPVLGHAIVTPRAELLSAYEELVRLGIRDNNTNVSEAVRLLHGRNWLQVLGTQLVVAYCKEEYGVPQGGTATAVKLAHHWQIPVFNLWRDEDRKQVEEAISR